MTVHNPHPAIADARELLAKYDELSVDARLQNGPVILAEVSARAAVAQAAALANIATALGAIGQLQFGGEPDAGA